MAIVESIVTAAGERRRLATRHPATGELLGETHVGTREDVRRVVERARDAQVAWHALGFDERRRVMERALDLLLRDQERFIEVIRSETGRSRVETIVMEIFPACDSLAYFGKHAKRLLRDQRVGLHLLKTKKLVVTYQPLGVVGVITPWNGPFILSLNPSVQALMAGNSVVVKPSEVTPRSGQLVAALFEAAGLPPGVFSVIQGDGETGAALVESGVDKVSFTGSVATGRKVGETCGRRLIPCSLELGGKDPMIVCSDADVERAAKGCVFGAMLNAGQFCCSTERVYVVEGIATAFTEQVVAHVRALTQGAEGEYDLGPMISRQQLDTVERHVADAVAKGARVLVGGKRNAALGGLFYEPTVLTDVTHDMLVMTEETFGPVLPIVVVKDENEALRLSNDSRYGLSSTVWTKSEERAMRLARQIESGSVCVNDSSITYGALEAPFGGMKESGLGQVHGEHGIRSYCFAKPVIFDRFQQKEEAVWYPFTRDKGALLQKVMHYVWGTRLGRLLT